MADWNLPTPQSGYINFVAEMNDKIADSGKFNFGAPINLPENAMRYSRGLNIFQEWVGGNWQNKVLNVAGGGTGATDVTTIRANLGLGSMAVQNSNAVNITGGSITGISFDIGSVASGILPLARGGTGVSQSAAAFGAVMFSNGAAAVFGDGTYISVLNASALSMGTVPQARLYNVGFLNGVNTWTGPNYFEQALYLMGSYPGFFLINNVATANMHRIYFFNYYGDMYVQSQNDDGTFSANIARFGNDGRVYMYGGDIHNINGANIATGIINPARLGSGAPSAATYLRGDGVWAAVATGGGEVSPIPSGMIAIFNGGCPAGWSRFVQLDNRFPLGSSGAGGVGGSDAHSHTFDVNSNGSGNHNHTFSGSFGGSGSGPINGGGTTGGPSNSSTADAGGSFDAGRGDHTHGFSISGNANVNVTTDINSVTGMAGDHGHRVTGGTSGANHVPPYYTVVFCMKN